jgi:signal transduction histidine kinase
VEAYLGIAALFQKSGSGDSCLSYAKKALSLAQKGSFTNQVLEAATFLTNYYSVTHNIDSAFAYQSAALAARDSLFSQEKQQEFQRLMINEATRQQQLVQDQLKYKNKVQLFAFLAGFALLIVVTSIVWRNYLQQRKAKTKIEEAYSQLKSTQSQLIQSEKMASLGELTAGIAHEIQNPLNFVNNFSEVNKEIIDEASQEVDKGNIVEVKNMLNDIRENEEKINHHGKRADAIVKSMLQHSRASSGKKEPTDINALADEYLRLSYHGLRAKDKDFNATIETDFDESIGEIEVVPQDIGRVLLNLYNNAFYAVSARQKAEGESFKPIVKIQTRKVDSKVEVVVKDNGNGIPQNVVNKIFQPFFTTKPTGQGTGLGLSLSYDIIKAHGGEIKVQSKEGEGAEFIIQLLLSNNI